MGTLPSRTDDTRQFHAMLVQGVVWSQYFVDSTDDRFFTASETLAEATALADSRGLLASARDNVFAPLINAALFEPWNGVTSSINDISSAWFDAKICTEAKPFQTPARPVFSQSWWLHEVSTGVGTILPLGLTILATRGGLSRLAGTSESALSNFIRKQSSATVLGAGIYDGLRKPREGETRWGNAIGGGSGFLVFEAGNHWGRNFTPLVKNGIRFVTGATGAAAHITVSELVSHQHLPASSKFKDGLLAGAVMNTVLPLAMDRFVPKTGDGVSEPTKSTPPVVATETTVLVPARPLQTIPSRLFIATASDLPQFSAGNRPRLQYSQSGEAASFPAPRPDQLITASRLSRGAILEFHERVELPVREFKKSAAYGPLRQQYSAILQQGNELRRSGFELIDELNSRKYVSEQIPLSDLADQIRMRERLRPGHELLPVYERLLVRSGELQVATRELLRNPELRLVGRQLKDAVGFLGDELEIPRMQVRTARLGRKEDAHYVAGEGIERLNAKALFSEGPSTIARSLGHETAHGYQDFLMTRHMADRLGLRTSAGPSGLKALQTACGDEFGVIPSTSWVKAVIALQNGQPLRADLANQAARLIAESGEFGIPSGLQIRVKGAARYFENPRVTQPVSNLLIQMQDWYVKDEIFPQGKTPDLVTSLQQRQLAHLPVETAANKEALFKYFSDLAETLESQRYARYRSALSEQDAWGFEQRIREVISGSRKRSGVLDSRDSAARRRGN